MFKFINAACLRKSDNCSLNFFFLLFLFSNTIISILLFNHLYEKTLCLAWKHDIKADRSFDKAKQ